MTSTLTEKPKRAPKTHPYYSFNRVCSYNATYNFVVGGRGLGKTFGIKERAIRDYIRKGDMFIYMRRYKGELSKSKATFFADVAYKFPKFVFRVHGYLAQMAVKDADPKDKNAWQTIGYFIALSTGQSEKSVSYPLVKTIIFDEFIIEKGAIHYLPDESTVFNNFYSTVDRWQDKTKVFFLANSVSIMNPYFQKYEIRPDQADENGFIKKADGFVVAHFPDSKLFAMSVFQTKFGKFIKDTDEEYADYAVGNNFADNHDGLIAPKDSNARYRYTIETKTGMFSVWYNVFTQEYTIQEKLPKQQIIFTLVAEKMGEGKTLLVYGDKLMQQMRSAFRAARITFDKPGTRNVFIQIFNR